MTITSAKNEDRVAIRRENNWLVTYIFFYWISLLSPRIIIMLSSQIETVVVLMLMYCAANDGKLCIMTTLGFHWKLRILTIQSVSWSVQVVVLTTHGPTNASWHHDMSRFSINVDTNLSYFGEHRPWYMRPPLWRENKTYAEACQSMPVNWKENKGLPTSRLRSNIAQWM